MKIVIDARTMGSKPSGIGIYTFNYVKELIKSKHELVLLTDVATSQEMQYMKNKDIQIVSYGRMVYQSTQVLKYFNFVREQLQCIQPDLFWEPNILIPKKLRGFKGKIMITIHDMFPVTHAKYFGWRYCVYFYFILRKTIRISDVILYDSAETKERTEKTFPDIKKRKTFVQYVIVPKNAPACDITECRNYEDKKRGYFLYVGNMEKRKGVDLLLEAYEIYRKGGGERALILAGKSRERDVDEKIFAITQKYKDVKYCGYICDEDKQQLYRTCGCFLFPSMAEGFGICVLEAMHYDRPIIVSDLNIFREIVGDCINYFSVDCDRTTQVSNLSQLMHTYNEQVDEATYESVLKKYTPEKLGAQMLRLLEEF